jgi:hypothetical protein
MDVSFYEFWNTLLPIGPVLVLYIVITVFIRSSGPEPFAIQKFLLSDHLPANRPATFLERCRSGLLKSGGVFSQFFFAGYFALPFLCGGILLALAEVYYLHHPEIIPWRFNWLENTGLWPTPGQVCLFLGFYFIFSGIIHSKAKAKILPRTTGIFRHLNKLDAYSMIALAAASILVLILAFFFIDPYAYYCVVLSIPIAIASTVIAYWLLKDLDAA